MGHKSVILESLREDNYFWGNDRGERKNQEEEVFADMSIYRMDFFK